MDKVNLVLFIRLRAIDSRQVVRWFNCSDPRLAGHELVAYFWGLNEEFIIAIKLVTLFTLLSCCSLLFLANLGLMLELVFVDNLGLQAFHVGQEVPLLVLVQICLFLHSALVSCIVFYLFAKPLAELTNHSTLATG